MGTPYEVGLDERAVLNTLAVYTAQAVERTLHLGERVTVARRLQQATLTELPQVPGLELSALDLPAGGTTVHAHLHPAPDGHWHLTCTQHPRCQAGGNGQVPDSAQPGHHRPPIEYRAPARTLRRGREAGEAATGAPRPPGAGATGGRALPQTVYPWMTDGMYGPTAIGLSGSWTRIWVWDRCASA
ncbi:hypothetical protein ACFVHW_14910 [Streptomyces sp. NPDC127110]|uniref:hypothetical protein n=1 Tax=Streptomyces sp. NPDC127110 TaxID=3345362 RepID=UPI0036334C1F